MSLYYGVIDDGKVCLIGDGKFLEFNTNGEFVREREVTVNLRALFEIDVLSLLVFNTGYELAWNINNEFGKVVPSLPLSELVRRIHALNHFVYMFALKGECEGLGYTQYLYIFLRGRLSSKIIEALV